MSLSGANRASGARNVGSETTLVVTVQSNFTAGSWAVLGAAYDNAGSGGSDPYSSISDSAGNTWTPRINSLIDPGAANAGQALRFFSSTMDVATLTTSHTITISFGSTVVAARSWALHEVAASAGNVGYVTGGQETATTATPTITTGSIASGDMVIAAVGREGNETQTGDSDTSNGSWSAALTGNVGIGTGGSEIISQRKVVTATGTQTYDTTYGGTSRDGCEAWVQFTELANVTGTGAVAFAKPALAASGTETFSASGGLSFAKPALAASGAETFSGIGAAAFARPALAGEGTVGGGAITGTGAVAFSAPALAVSGGETFSGAAALGFAVAALAAAGAESFSGTGAASLGKPTVAVVGAETFSATGAITIGPLALAASGGEGFSGQAALSLMASSLAAAGDLAFVGSGGVAFAGPALAAAGSVSGGGISGSGGIAFGFALAGAGYVGDDGWPHDIIRVSRRPRYFED